MPARIFYNMNRLAWEKQKPARKNTADETLSYSDDHLLPHTRRIGFPSHSAALNYGGKISMSVARSLSQAAKMTLADALSSARETRALVIGPGVITEIARVFQAQFPGRHAVIVADRQTFAIAAQRVADVLAAAGVGCIEPFVYSDPKLYAEYGFVEQLEDSLRQHDAIPVAVGAGTLNDLVKLAAHRVGRAYLCVATAASMDGYTAFGASITYRGAKQTFNCPAPRGVIADIEIIRRAPPEMTASGYADLLAKVTAGADWIFADALGAEPIDPRAWAIATAAAIHRFSS